MVPREGVIEKMNRLYIIVAAFFVLIFVRPARPAYGQSLEDFISEAMDHNLEVQAARERWRAAEAMTPSAWALPDPRIGLSYQKNPGSIFTLGEARMRMLTVSQTIPFPLKMTSRARLYHAGARQARWQYQAVRQDVAAKVKVAFYQLFVLQRSLDIMEEQIELLQSLEETARSQYAVGQAPQHEVLKAQVELSLMVDEKDILEKEKIPATRARLAALLNRPDDADLRVPDDVDLPPMVFTDEQLLSLALDHRPGLRATKEEVRKAEASFSLARWGYFPDLTVSFLQERMETSTGAENTRGLTLNINLPLWFWGHRAEVSEKKGYRTVAADRYGDLQSRTRAEVMETLAAYRSSRSRAELIETTILPLAEQSLKAARAAYENRQADFLDLLSAQRNLLDAQLKHDQALGDAGASLARLERVVGVQFSNDEEMR
jgi:cobalt-zinc-cadmium efflux system outer membrane protein